MLGAVLDGGHPSIEIVRHVLSGFPSKWRSFIEAGIALLLDDFGTFGDGVFEELDDVGFGLVNVAGRIMRVLPEVGADVRAGDSAGNVEIDGGDVQKILSEGAFVRLHFEVVFVLGEVFGHRDQLVADVVPELESFV